MYSGYDSDHHDSKVLCFTCVIIIALPAKYIIFLAVLVHKITTCL